jgi:hypothetical protein
MNTNKFVPGEGSNNTKKWPGNYVEFHQLPLNIAEDERSIQVWLEKNPAFLLFFLTGSNRGWVFGQPKLGGEYIPDFMVCTWDSRGYQWKLIELENPNYSILTQGRILRDRPIFP